jgi:hypothetical protein
MLEESFMQRSLDPHPVARNLPVFPGKRAGAPAPVRNRPGNGASRDVAVGGFRREKLLAPAAPVEKIQLRQKVASPAGITIALLGFYLALHTSFAGEIFNVFLHVPFPVVGIFSVIVPLVILFAGRPMAFFGSPAALPWVLLNLWIGLCSVLSFYPRDSITGLIPFELRLQVLPFLLCAVATTSKAVRSLLVWTAIGVLPVLLLCVTKGEMQDGSRFGIANTSLENPNDLAFHLLWGATLLLLFLLAKSKLGKIIAIVAIPSCFWFILKTASRANFLTLFAVLAVALLLASPSVKMLLLVAVPLGLAATLPLLPTATLDRILAIAVSSSASDAARQADANGNGNLEGAFGSEAARMELARLAVDATVRHPFFGVGIGMFANETADFIMRTTGRKAPWQTAHNSYLKISSENGVPGLIFYLWSILAAISMTWRTFTRSRRRPGFEVTNRNSACILLALAVYAVGTFFCDIVYLPYLAITVGLAAANFLAFRNEDRLAAVPVSGVR